MLLLATAAHASEATAAYLRAVKVQYELKQYDVALEQLQRAKAAAGGLDDDVQVALWEGVLFAELDRGSEAEVAFNTALALRPDARPPAQVSEKVAAQIERQRAAVKQRLAPAETAPLAPPPKKESRLWVPLLVTGVTAAIGIGCSIQAKRDYNLLAKGGPYTDAEARGIGARGSLVESIAFVSFTVAATAGIAWLVMWLVRAPEATP